MKILRVRGENLASLEAPFDVDLTGPELGRAGLFAITGPTGSGKSTLLDAICLCLYDKTPRLASRGGATVVLPGQDTSGALKANDQRNILRRGAGDGWAEVDFAARDGQQWTARWYVRRANLDPAGNPQAQELTLTGPDGTVFGDTKGAVLDRIRALVGLDFDQFRRSVLLAQGDFAAFLKAKDTERAELLEQMTGTDIYTKLSQQAFYRARDLRGARKDLQTRVDAQGVLPPEERAAAERALAAATATRKQAQAAVEQAKAACTWHQEHATLAQAVTQAAAAHAEAKQALDAAADRRARFARAEQGWPLRALAATLHDARERAAGAGKARDRARAERDAAKKARDAARDTATTAAARASLAADALLAQVDARLDSARSGLAEHQGWLDAHPVQADTLDGDKVVSKLETDLDRRTEARAGLAELARVAAARDTERRSLDQALAQARATAQEKDAALVRAETALKAAQADHNEHDDGQLTRDRQELRLRQDALAELRRLCDRAAASAAALAQADTDLAQATQAVTGATAAREQAEAALEALAPRLDEARAALDRARQAVGVEDLRASLEPGQPCAVCGSTDHPWADGSAVAELHAAQQARVQELTAEQQQHQQAATQAAARLEAATASKAAAEKARQEATSALAGLAAPWADHAAALGQDAPDVPADADGAAAAARALDALDGALAAHDQALQAREQAARKARKALDEARALRDVAQGQAKKAETAVQHAEKAVAKLQSQAERHGEREKALTERLAETDGELAAVLDPLADELPAVAGWRDSAPDAVLAVCRDARAAVVRHETRVKQARETIQALEARRPQDADRAREWRADLGAEDLAAAAAPTPPAGTHPPEVTEWWDGQLATLRDARRRARQDLETAEQALADADKALATATATATERAQAVTAAQQALDTRAADAGVDAQQLAWLREQPDDWLATERAALRTLEEAPEQAAAVVKERQERLAAHARDRPELDVDAAVQARDAATSALADADEAWVAARARVERDDAAQARVADLQQQLAEHDRGAKPWLQLADCIGSGNGQEFRRFAQSLTLEALLEHANAQLRQLRPRYSLARIHKTDLDIMVIDHDLGDEPRSVQSLSGGETFLASLALALGLSSLSSHDVRIESLFIDEGFGTLDEATLESAMGMLDGLQATGRQVGIISHVSGLARSIGARVQVKPLGGGRSRVLVHAR